MNQIFTHPGHPQMQVEVILASVSADSPQVTTMRLRYPRCIHAEIMTHRVFSRNARSSRAVPIKTMIQEVRDTPFVPWHWGKNQKGMQAGESLSPLVEQICKDVWLRSCDNALKGATELMVQDAHKQIVNRLLEPFMWIDTLITSTDWANFLWLRDHKDAEPHLQDLARLVGQALEAAKTQELPPGYWHLPYIKPEEYKLEGRWNFFQEQVEFLQKLSAARCARISYTPFDGDASYVRELERYDSLVSSDRIHASPLEHQATPDRSVLLSTDVFYEREGDLTPDETLDARQGWLKEELHGNLTGWIQYRKTIPGENHT